MLNDGTDSQIFTVNRDIEPKQSSCLVLFTYYGEYTDKDLARALFTKQKKHVNPVSRLKLVNWC